MDKYTHGKACFNDGEIVKKFGKVFDILGRAIETGSSERAEPSVEFNRFDAVPRCASVAGSKFDKSADGNHDSVALVSGLTLFQLCAGRKASDHFRQHRMTA